MTEVMIQESEVCTAVTLHNREKIVDCLKRCNVNHKFKTGNTLLWAITGCTYNLKQCVGKGNIDTVKLLLDNGADPNIKFMIYPALYYAVNEKRDDMVVLLMNYGGNPNVFTFKVAKNGRGTDICWCKTLLVSAVESSAYRCVEALVARGAIFNQATIDFACKVKDELFKKRKKSIQDYSEYSDAESIYTILKQNYDPKLDEACNSFVNNNSMTGKIMNMFIGLEKGVNA